ASGAPARRMPRRAAAVRLVILVALGDFRERAVRPAGACTLHPQSATARAGNNARTRPRRDTGDRPSRVAHVACTKSWPPSGRNLCGVRPPASPPSPPPAVPFYSRRSTGPLPWPWPLTVRLSPSARELLRPTASAFPPARASLTRATSRPLTTRRG